MIGGFIIWSICAAIFGGIGISCRKSREAAGFFTFVKPPVVEGRCARVLYPKVICIIFPRLFILATILSPEEIFEGEMAHARFFDENIRANIPKCSYRKYTISEIINSVINSGFTLKINFRSRCDFKRIFFVVF